MREIKKYVSEDGKEFDNIRECLEHEKKLKNIAEFQDKLNIFLHTKLGATFAEIAMLRFDMFLDFLEKEQERKKYAVSKFSHIDQKNWAEHIHAGDRVLRNINSKPVGDCFLKDTLPGTVFQCTRDLESSYADVFVSLNSILVKESRYITCPP